MELVGFRGVETGDCERAVALVGLITLIALGVALQIPIIGTLICVVLGCGLGLLAGVIAAALSAPTWACWLIGLVATGVMIGINIEDKNSDDFYD